MASQTLVVENKVRLSATRESRTQSIATRFTPTEAEALLKRANASGLRLREWAREVLLREVKPEESHFDVVCELVGLQLLMMNLLAPLARGERIGSDQFQQIVGMVQTTKVKTAKEMLSRRSQSREA